MPQEIPEYIRAQGLAHLWNKDARKLREDEETAQLKWLENYEAETATLRASRYGREADEIITIVRNHANGNTCLRKVIDYLTAFAGDERAAAEAEADAERAEFARRAFSHGTAPEPGESITAPRSEV